MTILVLQQSQADRDALEALKADAGNIGEDHHDYKGTTVYKPWGNERQAYKNHNISVWRLALNPRSETSLHCHLKKTAIMFMAAGSAVVETLAGQYAMEPGDTLIVEAGTFHRTRTVVGATMLEVEWPCNRNDLVRLADRYGRQGCGYEGNGVQIGIK